MKDQFSRESEKYAKYRLRYTDELIGFILSHCQNRETALDVGTGNGQLAVKLADHFKEVKAIDISEQQIKYAPPLFNMNYTTQPAEQTNFHDKQFDLISVAQAMHWFDLEKFYKEVKRTLKPDGLFAAIGYTLCSIDGLDDHLREFHDKKVGSYWDPERLILESEYQNIPFPFEDLGTTHFQFLNQWTFDEFIGYLKTWSAVSHYERINRKNPVDEYRIQFQVAWGEDVIKTAVTPVFVRLGRPTAW